MHFCHVLDGVTFGIIALNVDFANTPFSEFTFLIVHKCGHFNTIYVNEENRKKLYEIFNIHMTTNSWENR